ncbi:BCCT family transporter [Plastorhodobacter daqingensis]|uniref:BCCT family transporter n=1 Tax=Plastorhodobacter daqingensis TaxID=1387281 RepID=A0ABW2UL71_9RHOB
MNDRYRQPVFLISVAIILVLVAIGAAMPQAFGAAAEAGLDWATHSFGWFFLLSIFGFVAVLVFLAFSKYGDTRLGPPDSVPEFSYYSWVSMLLAAGFGIGLVFYGVAEPMSHYLDPPHAMAEPGTAEAAELAIQYSFFNWGVSQWAAFSIVGLIIGFFQFRKGKPGLVSVVLDPVTRRFRARRQISGALDIFAVVATVMGVATSLGLGVLQVNGGLSHLYGVPEGFLWQVIILGIMFVAYMISAATGLEKGIRLLSTINLTVALGLMVFVLVFGPTIAILDIFVQGIGDYLQYFVFMSLQTDPYSDSGWGYGWTIFYWAWVIAWSPFVGTFVARISYGRSIREFVVGVLVVPPLLACIWMGIFGGAALHLEAAGNAGLAAAVQDNITTSLFHFFELFPFSTLLSLLGMVLVFIFLITSADSASYVVSQLTDKGSIAPPLAKRLIWGALMAAICLTLIATGGLEALQAAAILAALPFILVLYAMVWMLFRELAADRQEQLARLYEDNNQTPVGASLEEARQMTEDDGSVTTEREGPQG